ncbi:MAG: DUF1850 domain-containing protein [Candidatus Accumulibacter sp.]|jgi:hypothetical protein|nr:DUF1850 domain-containing protein [Accumulibacter sp.]
MNAILALCALSAKRKLKYALYLCALALLALLLHPVDALTIRVASSIPPAPRADGESPLLFAASAPLGQEFATEYIHSVQLTPVQDIYRVVNGRIWPWQERAQSHNAGLPFAQPPCGRFRMDAPWMVFEGGRRSLDRIFLRVGSAELGRNVFFYGKETTRTALYEIFPGQRLQLSVERRPSLTLLFQARRFPEIQNRQ